MGDDFEKLQVTESGVPIPVPTEEEIAKALDQVARGQVSGTRGGAGEPEEEPAEPGGEE